MLQLWLVYFLFIFCSFSTNNFGFFLNKRNNITTALVYLVTAMHELRWAFVKLYYTRHCSGFLKPLAGAYLCIDLIAIEVWKMKLNNKLLEIRSLIEKCITSCHNSYRKLCIKNIVRGGKDKNGDLYSSWILKGKI